MTQFFEHYQKSHLKLQIAKILLIIIACDISQVSPHAYWGVDYHL